VIAIAPVAARKPPPPPGRSEPARLPVAIELALPAAGPVAVDLYAAGGGMWRGSSSARPGPVSSPSTGTAAVPGALAFRRGLPDPGARAGLEERAKVVLAP